MKTATRLVIVASWVVLFVLAVATPLPSTWAQVNREETGGGPGGDNGGQGACQICGIACSPTGCIDRCFSPPCQAPSGNNICLVTPDNCDYYGDFCSAPCT